MSKKIVLKSLWAVAMIGFVLSLSSCKKDVPPPTNLSVADITEISAKLSWTGSADSYEIQLTNPQGMNIVFYPTANTCLAANLTENTAYKWKVRAKKGDKYSEWTAGPSFTTIQETLAMKIVGTWEYEKIEVKEVKCDNPAMELAIKAGFQQFAGESFDDYLGGTYEFAQDGKLIYQTGIGDGEANYTVNGSKLTITDFDFVSGTFDFSISDKKMYWDVDGFEMADQIGISDLLTGMGVTKIILRITLVKQ